MRIAIVQFPGSNCERETGLAVKRAGMEPVECLWNTPKEIVAGFDGFIIVGGFSYEDRSRAGIIAALDPIMDTIQEQGDLGKPVLGICNGAQILVEKGMGLGGTLTDNIRVQNGIILGSGYYNAWVNIRLSDQSQNNAFTRYLTPKNILSLPVAHAEGRFVIPHELLAEMQSNGQNVFQYCDADGSISPEFPINPNGSVDNIAAISNKAGNVLAIMPHPERTETCDAILHSMRDFISDKPDSFEIVIETMIVDNHALSVENALQHRGISVNVQRYVHWEVVCDSPDVFEKIKATGVLFNDRKEIPLNQIPADSHAHLLLVRPKDDIQGKQTMQILKRHFNISGLHSVSKSIFMENIPIGNEVAARSHTTNHSLSHFI